MIDCPYWSKRGKDGGACDLGIYEGQPSLGICRKCIEKNASYFTARRIIENYYNTTSAKPASQKTGCKKLAY